MSQNNFLKSLQESLATEQNSHWRIGLDLKCLVNQLDATGSTNAGHRTIDEIIKSQGMSRSTGRLWLQVIENLEEVNYEGIPLSKLRYLLQLPNEEERQAFLKAHDIDSLTVRALEARVKTWKRTNEKDNHPLPLNQKQENASNSNITPVDELKTLLRKQIDLSHLIIHQLEEVQCAEQEKGGDTKN